MKLTPRVDGVPPKKDGANSMWRKGTELRRLKALRVAALKARLEAGDVPPHDGVTIRLRLFASPAEGDLDNFITGICDGLMAAHPSTPIDPALWSDVPPDARPDESILLRDDSLVRRIEAERLPLTSGGTRYELDVELVQAHGGRSPNEGSDGWV